jgi:hypothetical protein
MYKLISIFLLFVGMSLAGIAQDSLPPRTKTFIIPDKPKDHFLLQFGYVSWLNKPDSIATAGFSRSIGIYLMYDLAFKTDPRFSIGAGIGVGSDHVFFDENAGRDLVINNASGFQFKKHSGADTANKYSSMKLHTAYLDIPLELRFMNKPEKPNKSFKVALGIKGGILLTAVDKTSYERDGFGNDSYTMKIKDTRHFNSLRFVGTARIGYGNFGAFVQYQLNDLINEGRGPNQIRPLIIGITLSGL